MVLEKLTMGPHLAVEEEPPGFELVPTQPLPANAVVRPFASVWLRSASSQVCVIWFHFSECVQITCQFFGVSVSIACFDE